MIRDLAMLRMVVVALVGADVLEMVMAALGAFTNNMSTQGNHWRVAGVTCSALECVRVLSPRPTRARATDFGP